MYANINNLTKRAGVIETAKALGYGTVGYQLGKYVTKREQKEEFLNNILGQIDTQTKHASLQKNMLTKNASIFGTLRNIGYGTAGYYLGKHVQEADQKDELIENLRRQIESQNKYASLNAGLTKQAYNFGDFFYSLKNLGRKIPNRKPNPKLSVNIKANPKLSVSRPSLINNLISTKPYASPFRGDSKIIGFNNNKAVVDNGGNITGSIAKDGFYKGSYDPFKHTKSYFERGTDFIRSKLGITNNPKVQPQTPPKVTPKETPTTFFDASKVPAWNGPGSYSMGGPPVSAFGNPAPSVKPSPAFHTHSGYIKFNPDTINDFSYQKKSSFFNRLKDLFNSRNNGMNTNIKNTQPLDKLNLSGNDASGAAKIYTPIDTDILSNSGRQKISPWLTSNNIVKGKATGNALKYRDFSDPKNTRRKKVNSKENYVVSSRDLKSQPDESYGFKNEQPTNTNFANEGNKNQGKNLSINNYIKYDMTGTPYYVGPPHKEMNLMLDDVQYNALNSGPKSTATYDNLVKNTWGGKDRIAIRKAKEEAARKAKEEAASLKGQKKDPNSDFLKNKTKNLSPEEAKEIDNASNQSDFSLSDSYESVKKWVKDNPGKTLLGAGVLGGIGINALRPDESDQYYDNVNRYYYNGYNPKGDN